MSDSIVVHNLTKAYGHKKVLDAISFCIKKGEIFALLGPNGAGKSTMISIIATIMAGDSGNVMVEQHYVGVDNVQIRKKIGIVFQQSVLDSLLSVKQNLRTRCGFYGLPKKEAQIRIQEVSKACGLEGLLNQRVRTLSGGQRRRVDIARALISKPELLILDEPSSGLDVNAKEKIWDVLHELHNKHSLTIFMSTHDMKEAAYADHIGVVKQGKMIADEDKHKMKETYGKPRLVLYSSSMKNLMEVLSKQHIAYRQEVQTLVIKPLNHFHSMSILRACERYIEHFELTKSSFEEMYLCLLKEG